ncbi:MAG: hypothetical protein DRH10_07750, partial [Deltaproteobacteria bacterium]
GTDQVQRLAHIPDMVMCITHHGNYHGFFLPSSSDPSQTCVRHSFCSKCIRISLDEKVFSGLQLSEVLCGVYILGIELSDSLAFSCVIGSFGPWFFFTAVHQTLFVGRGMAGGTG